MTKKQKIILISLLVALIVVGLLFFYLITQKKENERKQALLNSRNFYDGIKIANIDVSGKSKEDAENILKKYVDGILTRDFHVIIDNESVDITLKDLGLQLNYKDALDDAYNLGRMGSDKARLNTIEQIKANPINFDIKDTLNTDLLSAYIKNLNNNYLSEPVEPHIEYTKDSFHIVEGKNGVEINIEKLISDIRDAIKNGKDKVVAEARVKEPKNSTDMLKRINGVIGEYSTLLGAGTQGRNDNIRLSCKLISDRILMPGESISFNNEMGEITAANGYKMASTIVGGKYVDSLGGGLCQTSTTLYNALVRADVEILERHPHSIAAPYVDVGADAAVWKGAKDLRFKNNWDFPILIKSWVDNKRIYFKIYGDTNEKNYDIDLKAFVTEVIPAGTTEKNNPDIAEGETNVINRGRNGQRASSTKIYKKNGSVFKEIGYFNSYYPMQNKVVEVGTGAVKTENPATENSGQDNNEGTNEEGPSTIDLFN